MMRESIDYTSIDSSYELERKKEASVTVQRVDSNDDEDPMLRPPSPLPMISWEPETLSEDPWWTIFYDAYDTFLCLLALTLMVKTSLVIYAWTIDKENHGPNLDKVSSLTKKLIAFNDQVSLNGKLCLLNFSHGIGLSLCRTGRHRLYYRLCHHRHHFYQTICPAQSSERRLYL